MSTQIVRWRRSAILGVLVVFAGACGPRPGPPTSAARPDADRPAPSRIEPSETPPAERTPAPPARLEPFPGVVVLPGAAVVELEARVCIEAGWLEQIACGPGTREHEALVVPRATASQIHAALLTAGFLAGRPGSWAWEDEQATLVAPSGTALEIDVRYTAAHGLVEEPIRTWIRDHHGRQPFPDDPWIFGGSGVIRDTEDGTERYVADITGSIIGLVTFGDEVIGFSRVLADQAAVQPPEWEVDTDRIPPLGTIVTLVIRERAP